MSIAATKADSQATLTICWVVRGLVELEAAQSITGVRRWAESVFETPLAWVQCAEYLASAKYEDALACIDKHLKDENLLDHVRRSLEEMVRVSGCQKNYVSCCSK